MPQTVKAGLWPQGPVTEQLLHFGKGFMGYYESWQRRGNNVGQKVLGKALLRASHVNADSSRSGYNYKKRFTRPQLSTTPTTTPLLFHRRQPRLCRPHHADAVISKPTSMHGTIPALLCMVPSHNALQVRTER